MFLLGLRLVDLVPRSEFTTLIALEAFFVVGCEQTGLLLLEHIVVPHVAVGDELRLRVIFYVRLGFQEGLGATNEGGDGK